MIIKINSNNFISNILNKRKVILAIRVVKKKTELNHQQKEAVQQVEGPVMIIAGPGSGKTRVITERIAHLLNLGISAHNILALTFTNKAANEMKMRIHEITRNQDAFSIWMGTFHSVFAKILRKEAHIIGFSKYFTIYDNEDSVKIIRRIIKDWNLDKDTYNAKYIFSRISFMKNNLIDFQNYKKHKDLIQQDQINKREKFTHIYTKYCEECKSSNSMDFDDLLIYTYKLFHKNNDILEHYREMFKYVLIDEYQDTNRVQDTIIKQISSKHQNVCIVGDDSQSIYSFRGADINNMLKFKMFYTNVREFKLEQNYRSTQNIVNAANSLIAHNKNKIEKTIFSSNEKGEKIKVFKYLNDREEGDKTASMITNEIRNGDTRRSDYAILYRNNSQSKVLEDSLRKREISYKIFGGLSFYQRKEIKDIMAFLKLIINHNDDEALIRIINYPTRGIGMTTIEKLRAKSAEKNISIWETLESNLTEELNLRKNTRQKIIDFVELMQGLFDFVDNNIFETAKELIEKTKIIEKLEEDPTEENINRIHNISELFNSMKIFSMRKNNNTLMDFINEVSLDETKDENKEVTSDYVSLMTIHQSKGLEFKYVYIVGLENDLFPSQKSMQTKSLIEEERRLFYVAITRAINYVRISYAENRFRFGSLLNTKKSFFIDEINYYYLEEIRRQSQPNNNSIIYQNRLKPKSKQQIHPPKLQYRKLKKIRKGINENHRDVQVGQHIIHNIFGKGKIKKIDESDGNQKITVFFVENGEKTLLTKFAKFEIIT